MLGKSAHNPPKSGRMPRRCPDGDLRPPAEWETKKAAPAARSGQKGPEGGGWGRSGCTRGAGNASRRCGASGKKRPGDRAAFTGRTAPGGCGPDLPAAPQS